MKIQHYAYSIEDITAEKVIKQQGTSAGLLDVHVISSIGRLGFPGWRFAKEPEASMLWREDQRDIFRILKLQVQSSFSFKGI